jgi:nucleolar protein 58
MTLLVLQETPAGYALFKAKDKKLLKRDDIAAQFDSVEKVCEQLKLKTFAKFDSAAAALEEAAAIVEGKVTPQLSALLDTVKDEKKLSLAVADAKLGNAIGKIPGLDIKAVADSTTADLYRAVREYIHELVPQLAPEDSKTMSLGLSHSLARHKLKFSADKIDVMIIQAIGLLDDLDKELNTYAMRVKEWYGWHFPEMAKILNDNLAYAKVVLKMGMRESWEDADLAEILPEEIEAAVKSAADKSMGTEITPEDLENIQNLAEQVVQFSDYRTQLASYLTARMTAIAPNLTALVGDLVGARLIAHAGSLMSLSKNPASTIQILGAEKALFRALKTKHDTPKYGLIYHASLIGQASGKNKGKMARVLAAKAALGLRVDALHEWEDEENVGEEEKAALGLEARAHLERKLAAIEGKPLKSKGVAIGPDGMPATTQPKKWDIKEAKKYNADADALDGDEDAATAPKKSKKLIEEIDDTPMTNGNHDESEDESEEAGAGDKAAQKAEKRRRKEEKLLRKLERKEKRESKSQKADDAEDLEALAAKAGISAKKLKKKLEKGEMVIGPNGVPTKVKEGDAEPTTNGTTEKKRKREEDEPKSEKKKKRKEKA